MPKTKAIKRGQGRPTNGGVGREAIIESVKQILRELPPARITISLVAREAGVDPALVRYYFKDRSNLLLEVVNSLLEGLPQTPKSVTDPQMAIEQRIRESHRFSRSAKHMQRLMIDELADAKSDEVRQKHRQLNLRAIAVYRHILEQDDGERLRSMNPMFLYLTIVGIFDFFVSAEPMVRNIVDPGTDMGGLADDYSDFVTDLLMNGLLK